MQRTAFCRQWESFRNLLNNQQRHNLGVLLAIELETKKLKNGVQRIIIVTPAPQAAVFVYMHQDVLHIVGGHWLRKGEPTQAFLTLIRADIAKLKKPDLK